MIAFATAAGIIQPSPPDMAESLNQGFSMNDTIKKQSARLMAGVILAAFVLTGCGKPSVAKREHQSSEVSTESGELPAAGKANRLVSEQSAYLRLHANDPVDWYPWGQEAFEKAKRENKPLLVSIGYASCPWSQKMQTESFLDATIARFMNRHFICVLVDREERPDVNTAFLHFAFWKRKISGWPLHVWLSPEGMPFDVGVYFPPESQGNIPSWRLNLETRAKAWEDAPLDVAKNARMEADIYLRQFRQRWLGPQPEGNPEAPEVKAFRALPPDEQMAQFLALNDDRLQSAAINLPASHLEEMVAKLKPEQTAGLTGRLRPLAAAALSLKLQGALRDSVMQRYLSASRSEFYAKLAASFDPSYGGFGPPPRFAPHQPLDFLIRFALRERGNTFGRDREAVDMCTLTISKLLAGGMRDQLGDGFHRYSTDVYWSVPQFEKMIYDQGYMAQALVIAGQLLGKREYLLAAAGALGYAARDLSHPEGGFYCAEGSSSKAGDGQMIEGAYYVWEKKEVDAIAGAAAPLVNTVFGIEERGNLPMDSTMRGRLGNTNVLMMKQTPEAAGKELGIEPAAARTQFEQARAKLLAARSKRPRPTLEDKILTSWSGVAISGFARTGWALGDAALIQRGEKAATFILEKLRSKDGGLLHAYLDGAAPLPGYSEDYATFIAALMDLYDATGSVRWLSAALQLQERQITDLWDKEDGGFFDGPDSPLLFHRMKSMDETSEISAGSSSLLNLVQLHNMLNIADYRDKARRIVDRFGSNTAAAPGAFTRFLRAAEFLLDPPLQFVLSGTPDDAARTALLEALRPCCRPGSLLLYMDGGESQKLLLEKVPDLAPLSAQPGKSALHLCRGFKTEKSFTTAAALSAWIKANCTVAAP